MAALKYDQSFDRILNQGDIIRAINKITVRDFEQMEAAIATSNRGMLLNIERDKRMLYILIR